MPAFYRFSGMYSPQVLSLHSDKCFVFGDNVDRYGKGGQAVIRNLSNSLGVATKWHPDNDPDSFFRDDHFHETVTEIVNDLKNLMFASHRKDIVIPFTSDGRISLGLGLARLDQNAPVTYSFITTYIQSLVNTTPGWVDLY